MFARCASTALVVLAMATPAWAAVQGNLQVMKEVSRQVNRYPHFTIFDAVQAQMNNGVLTLTGKVTMPYKRQDIERRVAKIDGVREVENRIEVLPVSQFDDQLRVQIARAIYSHPAFVNYSRVNPPIHVIVEHGRVTLDGVVRNNMDRVIAQSLASQFLAFSVKSDLKTDAEVRQQMERL